MALYYFVGGPADSCWFTVADAVANVIHTTEKSVAAKGRTPAAPYEVTCAEYRHRVVKIADNEGGEYHLLTRDLAAIANDVAQKLAYAFKEKDGFYISLPLLYSSGSSVVVNISADTADEFVVSDMGGGYQEASKTGAEHFYTRAANTVAGRVGVRCNDNRIWEAVDFDQLVATVTVVGNCSLEACSLAEERNVDRKKVLVAEFLEPACPHRPRSPTREPSIAGSSGSCPPAKGSR